MLTQIRWPGGPPRHPTRRRLGAHMDREPRDSVPPGDPEELPVAVEHRQLPLVRAVGQVKHALIEPERRRAPPRLDPPDLREDERIAAQPGTAHIRVGRMLDAARRGTR